MKNSDTFSIISPSCWGSSIPTSLSLPITTMASVPTLGICFYVHPNLWWDGSNTAPKPEKILTLLLNPQTQLCMYQIQDTVRMPCTMRSRVSRGNPLAVSCCRYCHQEATDKPCTSAQMFQEFSISLWYPLGNSAFIMSTRPWVILVCSWSLWR